MKVCKIENFPGDEIECRKCRYCLLTKGSPFDCLIAKKSDFAHSNCPSEGCRPDCPLIPTFQIVRDLKAADLDAFGISNDSIKFIKACEDNQ